MSAQHLASQRKERLRNAENVELNRESPDAGEDSTEQHPTLSEPRSAASLSADPPAVSLSMAKT